MGIREIGHGPSYGYLRGLKNTDPFIRKSLKLFDYQLYDGLRGWTKRPGDIDALYASLNEFDGANKTYMDLTPKWKSAFKAAMADTRKRFSLPHRVEPVDWDVALSNLQPNTGAGETWPGKKKREVWDEVFDEGRFLAHRAKQVGNPWKVTVPMCQATVRGALSEVDVKVKTRLAWFYPAEMLMCEAIYSVPLIARYQDTFGDHPMHFGRHSLSYLRDRLSASLRGKTAISVDWSKFDATIPPWLISFAFSVLEDNIAWGSFNGKPVSKRDQIRWKRVWRLCEWYFIHTPIRMPDGRQWRKDRGVPSGSNFTQLIDSIVNYCVIRALCIYSGVDASDLAVLGDDSDFTVPSDSALIHNIFNNLEELGKLLGMKPNLDKIRTSIEPQERKFLGYQFKRSFLFRTTDEWFKLALYSERDVNHIQVSWTRIVGLLLTGGVHDPEFCAFAQYFQRCYPLNAYRLDKRGIDWRRLQFSLNIDVDSFLRKGKISIWRMMTAFLGAPLL